MNSNRPAHQKYRLSSPCCLYEESIYSAHSEDSDQTVQMPRVIWIVAGGTSEDVFLCRGSICLALSSDSVNGQEMPC